MKTRALEGVGSQDVPALLVNAQRTFSHLPAQVLEMAHLFDDAGQEIALVGGPVRDAFLGVTPHDFDFATSARPDETEELLSKWADAVWDIGKKFGTIGARKDHIVVEITTYRCDEYDIGSRKPDVTFGDTLEGDPVSYTHLTLPTNREV